jgi:hypothetical protein
MSHPAGNFLNSLSRGAQVERGPIQEDSFQGGTTPGNGALKQRGFTGSSIRRLAKRGIICGLTRSGKKTHPEEVENTLTGDSLN